MTRYLKYHLNATFPSDWKRVTLVPIYKGRDQSAVSDHRPIRLTSVVSKQLEHVVAEYMRQIWDKNDWLHEGQHGFIPGYSCESKVIAVCQDIADSLDEGVGINAIIIDFPNAFDLVPHDRLLYETGGLGSGFEDSRLGKEIPCSSRTKGKSRRATI